MHGYRDLTLTLCPTVRTKPRYEYSYIEAAAIKIGTDILEIGSWGDFMINGVSDAATPFLMGDKYPQSDSDWTDPNLR